MPRFVILTHDHPFLHWDFMLESGDTLRTWRLLDDPNQLVLSCRDATESHATESHATDSGCGLSAEPLADHRLKYLDYEGPVSENRGTVSRWDHGDYTLQDESPERLSVHLHGQRLRGAAVLEFDGEGGGWRFRFVPID